MATFGSKTFPFVISKQVIMSDTTSAAKRAAERRRKKILAKSQARMSVVSGQGDVGSVRQPEGPSEGMGRKTIRRRRQRPSFMTKNYDVETKPQDQGKIRTAKGNKIPDTTSATIGGDNDGAASGNKASTDSVKTDEADVIIDDNENKALPPLNTKSTFSSRFRNRVRKKKSVEESCDTADVSRKDFDKTAEISKETSATNRKKQYERFNSLEEFFYTWSQVALAFFVVNSIVVTKIADIQDEHSTNDKSDLPSDSKFTETGARLYSGMQDFPVQRIGILIIFVRFCIQAVFYVLRARFYPLLSVESKDHAGNLASAFQWVDHIRGVFDDMCIFIFSYIVFCISVASLDVFVDY